MDSLAQMDALVKEWMHAARTEIIQGFKQKIAVWTKSGRNDLVTNMDRAVEAYYVEKIHTFFPEAVVIGEECHHQQDKYQTSGWVWVIDPIDGTMNFVKQQDHFASMIGVYHNGVGVRGYIFDVMNDDLFWGGPEKGVFCNETSLQPPLDTGLRDGLIGIGMPYLVHNYRNLQQVALASSGVRIYGSAGIQIIHVLQGKCTAYVSYLRPWDFAAGKILAEALNLQVKTIDGCTLDMLSSSDVLVATKNAQKDIQSLVAPAR
ncbi:inositol monophosphatase family protein [Liquorilactobacillus satsumensis]|uniref:Myo-inositol-1(Or 4)-monophosphatase n=1 Tax=Liquorilactobacillus satsumensis DSM 16230 = JCM 12392 TaxID=1423801 RepID=A0A0R1V9D9_9LACO|nr:inositol monophosphatase family protein [Liquorilactobacillus satsumensis]KRL99944.1 myo-inositol-1(or 4)-monophosphatase [Liquorilactobacillus satsumensis DSM 16230 = JCM 12392]MCP9311776.1 inositol monophosphatase family protein [Liquorilactobacillus satsumensis]MCP9328424.1 inositol monophosphatase family protein [Liquorilactobacillus satsumensis]MCP9358909.1 inositol monophosphatase family protein [Liquorilactobacillus satsumensis]